MPDNNVRLHIRAVPNCTKQAHKNTSAPRRCTRSKQASGIQGPGQQHEPRRLQFSSHHPWNWQQVQENHGLAVQPNYLPDSDPIKLVIDQPIGQQLFSPGPPVMHVNSPQILPSGRRISSSMHLLFCHQNSPWINIPDKNRSSVVTRS